MRINFLIAILTLALSSNLLGQLNDGLKIQILENSLDSLELDSIKSIESISNINLKYEKILGILKSKDSSPDYKNYILKRFSNEEMILFPDFLNWLKSNISYKIKYTFDGSAKPITSEYPILEFLINLDNPEIFSPIDLIDSDLFNNCNLFNAYYEKTFLSRKMYEFFIKHHGYDISDLEEETRKKCVLINLRFIFELCVK